VPPRLNTTRLLFATLLSGAHVRLAGNDRGGMYLAEGLSPDVYYALGGVSETTFCTTSIIVGPSLQDLTRSLVESSAYKITRVLSDLTLFIDTAILLDWHYWWVVAGSALEPCTLLGLRTRQPRYPFVPCMKLPKFIQPILDLSMHASRAPLNNP
jgi:hypothetical protein